MFKRRRLCLKDLLHAICKNYVLCGALHSGTAVVHCKNEVVNITTYQ